MLTKTLTINNNTFEKLETLANIDLEFGKTYGFQIQNLAEVKIANAKFDIQNKQFTFVQGDDDFYIKTNNQTALISVIELPVQRKAPDGFTLLKYLQSDGECYVDLNYISNGRDTIEQKFQRPSTYANNTISWFGSLQSSSGTNLPRIGFGVSSQNGFFAGYNATKGMSSYDNEVHIAEMYWSDTYYVRFDGVASSYNISSTAEPTITSYLFARHGASSITKDGTGTSIFYHKQKREDGTKVADILPMKRNSDNELGVYNYITKEFLTNKGTGTFTGEEL